MKIRKSKSGKPFIVNSVSRPPDGDIIYLTNKEFEWILKQNFKGDEFDFIYLSKLENYALQIIPETEIKESIKIAQKYSSEIITKLRGGS